MRSMFISVLVGASNDKAKYVAYIIRLLRSDLHIKIIVFVSTKHKGLDLLMLLQSQYSVAAKFIYGGMDDKKRRSALKAMSGGSINIIISTDTLTHGLDIQVDHVLMYDIPSDLITLMQRIGRANRCNTDNATVSIAARYTDIERRRMLLQGGGGDKVRL